MTTLLCIAGLSFVTCLLLTPLVRALAARFGLVDHPDGNRKLHANPIPVAGGIAILLSLGGGLACARLIPNPLLDQLDHNDTWIVGLFLAGVVICLVGIRDDLVRLRGRYKLLGQLLAVAILIGSGVVVQRIHLFEWEIKLGFWGVPFTIFWLLGTINSLNLIDGMDGMLSTLGLIICLALATMAMLGEQWVSACVAVALAGALLAFLFFNYPPATIFLGDSGSMLIGLVVGVVAIRSSLKGPATVALAAPIAILTLPIFDTIAAIIRRKLTGRSLYTTDRSHLHHCLMRRGLSNQKVLLFISIFCLVTVVGTLGSLLLKNEIYAVVSGLAVIAILIATRLFGYAELSLLKNHLWFTASSLLQRSNNGKAREIEVRFQGVTVWEDLWGEVTRCAAELRLKTVSISVNAPAVHEGYYARWDSAENHWVEGNLWQAQMPLVTRGKTIGRLDLVGRREGPSDLLNITSIVELVENFLAMVSTLGPIAPEPPHGRNGQSHGHGPKTPEISLDTPKGLSPVSGQNSRIGLQPE